MFYEKENKDVDKTKRTSPRNGRTIDGALARLGSVGLGEGQEITRETRREEMGPILPAVQRGRAMVFI